MELKELHIIALKEDISRLEQENRSLRERLASQLDPKPEPDQHREPEKAEPEQPEFPEEAEAIQKEGASKLLVNAVRRGFITYSHALKLIKKPPETQDRVIFKAERQWFKAKQEREEVQQRACIEMAVNLLTDRLAEEGFGRFVDLLRSANFFFDDTVFSEALHIEAHKRGILVDDEEDEDVEETTPPSMAA